jgi:hypothetical protein
MLQRFLFSVLPVGVNTHVAVAGSLLPPVLLPFFLMLLDVGA